MFFFVLNTYGIQVNGIDLKVLQLIALIAFHKLASNITMKVARLSTREPVKKGAYILSVTNRTQNLS